MCGILAVLGVYRGAEHVKERVLERARRIRHRGPDWSGLYMKGKNLMAHERLAIVGVDSGEQPLFNDQGNLVLAVNGEIYNHLELRANLKTPDPKFKTGSDCEVLLHLFEEEGPGFVDKLNGIFAFVLLDERTNQFLIARDHVGIIPLYWGRDADGAVWVASELKALHDVCVSFEDFPPGHLYDSSTQSMTQWYSPIWYDEARLPQDPLDIPRLRHELMKSVERQMMAEVPFGVLLSGGLDSSIISAVCAKIIKENPHAAFPRLQSFSIGLEGSPDLAAARIAAAHIGTKHHSYVFTVDEGLNAVRDVIYHLETYDVTTVRAATPMYLMSRKIKALGVKMVLSGEGADEVFGGYLYFHKCPNIKEFQKESVRKVRGLYKFDCLRANKSTAAWGVEARVPFLDKEFLEYALGAIDPTDKMCGAFADPKGRIEKWILRKAFEDLLPDAVCWRQKEQFSDGVGYSWIDGLQASAAKAVSDLELETAKFRFPHNPPATKEAYLIRSTYERHFPEKSAIEAVPGGPSVACSTPAALEWDAAFKKFADCSGRSIRDVHTSAYDDKRREEQGVEVKDEEIVDEKKIAFCTKPESLLVGAGDATASEAKRRKQ